MDVSPSRAAAPAEPADIVASPSRRRTGDPPRALGVPVPARVGDEHGDLRVLDPTRGARGPSRHPDRPGCPSSDHRFRPGPVPPGRRRTARSRTRECRPVPRRPTPPCATTAASRPAGRTRPAHQPPTGLRLDLRQQAGHNVTAAPVLTRASNISESVTAVPPWPGFPARRETCHYREGARDQRRSFIEFPGLGAEPRPQASATMRPCEPGPSSRTAVLRDARRRSRKMVGNASSARARVPPGERGLGHVSLRGRQCGHQPAALPPSLPHCLPRRMSPKDLRRGPPKCRDDATRPRVPGPAGGVAYGALIRRV